MTAEVDRLAPIRNATPRRRRELAHEAGVSVRDRLSVVNALCRRSPRESGELTADDWRTIADYAASSIQTLEALRQYAEGVATVLDAEALTVQVGELLADAAEGARA